MNLQVLLAIGTGGFIGAISRAYLIHTINNFHNYPIPIATIIVNIIGSLLLGALFAYFQYHSVQVYLKSFLATGLLGAFTTFSTFAMESVFLLSSIKLFFLYIIANTIGSILLAFIAYKGILFILEHIS